MLKERFEKTKKFIKEHKTEILIGGISIAGAVVGVKLFKNEVEKINIKNENNKATRLWMQANNNINDEVNNVLIPFINDKYKDYDFGLTDDETQAKYEEYLDEYNERYNRMLADEIERIR